MKKLVITTVTVGALSASALGLAGAAAAAPPNAPDAPGPNDPAQFGRAPTECPPANVIGEGFPTTAVGNPAIWELQDLDMSAIASPGISVGIVPSEPQAPGTLSCLYEELGEAPDIPPFTTMAIVGVLPIEKPMADGANAVQMSGVDRAWFEDTLFFAVVDGWTLGVPLVLGSVDPEKSALDIAQAVIAWSR
jgi:hypothetical protein